MKGSEPGERQCTQPDAAARQERIERIKRIASVAGLFVEFGLIPLLFFIVVAIRYLASIG